MLSFACARGALPLGASLVQVPLVKLKTHVPPGFYPHGASAPKTLNISSV